MSHGGTEIIILVVEMMLSLYYLAALLLGVRMPPQLSIRSMHVRSIY